MRRRPGLRAAVRLSRLTKPLARPPETEEALLGPAVGHRESAVRKGIQNAPGRSPTVVRGPTTVETIRVRSRRPAPSEVGRSRRETSHGPHRGERVPVYAPAYRRKGAKLVTLLAVRVVLQGVPDITGPVRVLGGSPPVLAPVLATLGETFV